MHNKTSLIENSIVNISYVDSNIIQHDTNSLKISNTALRQKIQNSLDKDLGQSILKLSLDPDDFVRYKDGKVSSMIRGTNGITGHSGFELMQVADIVDQVMFEVENSHTQQMLFEFNRATETMLAEIHRLQQSFLSIFNNVHEQEHIDQLQAAFEFLHDVKEELLEISASPERKSAYLFQVIELRRIVHKINKFFLRRLSEEIDLVAIPNCPYNLANVNNYYMQCRIINTCYALCTALEYILSGCVTQKALDNAYRKIEKFVQNFSYEINRLKEALKQRRENLHYWATGHYYYQYSATEEANALFNAQQNFHTNQALESETVKKLFDKSKLLFEDILILEEDSYK